MTKKLLGQGGEFVFSCDFKNDVNELISIFGASGSGKSTLLRMIAGLEKPDSGYIKVAGETWFDSSRKIDLTPQRRKVGFVFQEYSLFPNMSVLDNILFAQPKKNLQKAKELLALTELTQLANSYPSQISGGQKQRAAIARAIAREPNILLLDEPFSALDINVKRKLQDELSRLKTALRLPIIFVSHDKEEVFRLSDKVAIVRDGKISKITLANEAFFDSKLSSKFSFFGTILDIKKVDVAYIAYLSIGGQIAQVLISESDLEELKVGDEVQVSVKAFNPILQKI
ncbi:MAG TPA: ATP-binding cassette domain-containing protein [Campylobacterales bacterium]|nr:ATP-binding cassette domain-containing protein [Campylobacterales bacterium]